MYFCRNVNQRHVSGKAAVVPPIRVEGGHAVSETSIVDGDYDEVLARMNTG